MSVVPDAAERAAALDLTRSFIVEAPAGSGKTGLLTQRYLALLAHCERPEDVLAITFTRKAAVEMRERVLGALADAAHGPGADILDPHARLTRELARSVLDADRRRGWQLRALPARLRVTTIDGLCRRLSAGMPLLSGLGAALDVCEDPAVVYRQVALQVLELLDDPDWRAPLGRLLAHLDNDMGRFARLLTDMLGRRDQWLRFLDRADGDATRHRARLEAAAAGVVAEALAGARRTLAATGEGASVAALARYAAHGLEGTSASEDRPSDPILACGSLTDWPEADAAALARWRGLASLLLTARLGWRRRFDRRCGFLPGRDESARMKALAASTVSALEGAEGALEALRAVSALPDPSYREDQWAVLLALVEVLKLACGMLKVVFAERGQADFIEIVAAACQALGPPDQPTDLALALDYRIAHLLVDEFQDTSHSHEQLLRLLTRGWQPSDGRTLFLVGDPMQSIYRFREADVGVFLRAASEGFGAVPLERLVLRANFRSRPEVVTWVNELFPQVLAGRDDPSSGAVSYRPAAPVRAGSAAAGVRVHPLPGADAVGEGRFAADLAEAALRRHEASSVAVLARSRAHLIPVADALRRRGVPYVEVGVQPLAEVPAVRDLVAITRALLHPCDRVAWLALLRAPWCGLTLAELHALVGDDHRASVAGLLEDEARRARLGEEARSRLERLCEVVRGCVVDAGHRSLRDRVEGAWVALGGPAVGARARFAEAEDYLDLLEALAREGEVDADRLSDALRGRRASGERREGWEAHGGAGSGADPGGQVQLMTVHRAKGLEFDSVVLTGLGRVGRSDDRALLAWTELAPSQGRTELLLAPLPGSGQEQAQAPLYRYLVSARREQHRLELARLLYVAVTRARERLHLVAGIETDAQGGAVAPAADTMLASIWAHLPPAGARAGTGATRGPDAAPAHEPSATARSARDGASIWSLEPGRLIRFPARWSAPPPPAAVAAGPEAPVLAAAGSGEQVDFDWAGETARHVGTLVHRILQHLAGPEGAGPQAACPERVDPVAPAWHSGESRAVRAAVEARAAGWREDLAALGVPAPDLDAAGGRVRDAVLAVLTDPRGRWLLLAPHRESESELALSGVLDDRVRRVVMDRSFVDEDGVRWIVDFKTGSHEGAGREQFLDREQERYRPQLEDYARLMSALDDRPIRLGLYFPLLRGWRSWAYRGPERGA